MMMYLLMFAAAIKLRWKNTKQTRAFQIPGGIIGMCVTGLIGIVGVSVTFAVSFIPPEGLMNIGSVARYESLLVVGLVVMCLPPFLAVYRTKFSRSELLARQITSE